jgi:hypothetical protein
VRRATLGAALAAALLALGAALPAGAAPKPLLPDLIPLYPEQIIGPETGTTPDMGLGNPASVMVNGCFPDETSRRLALRCLRFDSRVGNVGRGPLEIEYRQAGAGFMAYQRILRSDGSIDEREAASTSYHPTHTHFHIDGFYIARLWATNDDGTPLRSRPPAASGDKSGFCPEDSRKQREGAGEGAYSCFGADGAHLPTSFVGISSGWMDVYGSHLPDQFIEISDLSDGRFVLEIEIDPNNVFLESDETNNRVCSLISVRSTEARMLDPQVPCLKGKSVDV